VAKRGVIKNTVQGGGNFVGSEKEGAALQQARRFGKKGLDRSAEGCISEVRHQIGPQPNNGMGKQLLN
jgi:hypothetical protein